MSRLKALVFGAVAAGVAADSSTRETLPAGGKAAGTITFLPLRSGRCGEGDKAYYGYVEPAVNSDPDKFFILLVGGGICWSMATCQDNYDRAWLSMDSFFKEKLGLNDTVIGELKNGTSMPLADFMHEGIRPGYLPADSSHPLAGRRGIYLPTCTGDFLLGRHTLTYNDELVVRHYGALNMGITLNMLKNTLPDLKEIALLGGSGGGISAAAWMDTVVDKWKDAKVNVLVDSGFLMFPGSDMFDWWDQTVTWGTGPAMDKENRLQDTPAPILSWTEPMLAISESRIRVAYLACDDDGTVSSDRKRMRLDGAQVGDTLRHLKDQFCLLVHLRDDSPANQAYSYFAECESHYISRDNFPQVANIAGTITAKTFVENFLAGNAPDPGNPTKSAFWFDNHDKSICPAKTTTTPEPQKKKEDNTQEVNGGAVATPTWPLLCGAAWLALLAPAALTIDR